LNLGKIRLIEYGYLFEVLTQVLNCVEAFSWERENIVKRVVIEELGSLQPEFILEKVFQWFFTPQQQQELNMDHDGPGISQGNHREAFHVPVMISVVDEAIIWAGFQVLSPYSLFCSFFWIRSHK